jgi:hypothetical protein
MGDDMVEVMVAVPRAAVRRMQELVDASGVSLSAFFSASLALRVDQHEGRERLVPELEAVAKRYM